MDTVCGSLYCVNTFSEKILVKGVTPIPVLT